MACKCKVNTQIDFLHEKYGDNLPKSKKTNIRGNVLARLKNLGITILLLPLVPVFIVYAAVKAIKGETIHIDKLVKRA